MSRKKYAPINEQDEANIVKIKDFSDCQYYPNCIIQVEPTDHKTTSFLCSMGKYWEVTDYGCILEPLPPPDTEVKNFRKYNKSGKFIKLGLRKKYKGMQRKCVYCGKVFNIRVHNQAYCSEKCREDKKRAEGYYRDKARFHYARKHGKKGRWKYSEQAKKRKIK